MRQEGATAQQLDSLFVRAACHLDRSSPTCILSSAKIFKEAVTLFISDTYVAISLQSSVFHLPLPNRHLAAATSVHRTRHSPMFPLFFSSSFVLASL
ncbi:hypothetical protein KCU83_g394, partial [Aureobasidium melanogenum]